MTPTTEQLGYLKEYGFKWFKDNTTDAVDADCIADVVPAVNGFTVIYNENATALVMSTATVEKIDFPSNPKKTWIFVHWGKIEDHRREGK